MDDIINQIDKQIYSEKEFPLEWAETQIRIADSLFEIYSRSIDKDADDNKALDIMECLSSAMRVYTENKYPNKWAEIQVKFANLYIELKKNEDNNNYIIDHLSNAIEFLLSSIRVYSRSEHPLMHAEVSIKLGETFIQVAMITEDEDSRKEYCMTAIRSFRAALHHFNENKFTIDYAETQIKIADALIELSSRHIGLEDANKNMFDAIGCLKSTGRVYTEDKFPNIWAEVNLRLGKVYEKLAKVNENYISKPLEYLNNALKFYNQNQYPQEWAEIQLRIAECYKGLAEKTENEETSINYLNSHIHSLGAALTVESNSISPEKRALIHCRIGEARSEIAVLTKDISDQALNVDLAVWSFEAAQNYFTEIEHPSEWAGIQKKLADVYSSYPCVEDEKISNTRMTLSLLIETLRVYTKKNFPEEYAIVQNEIGHIYYEIGELLKACKAYGLAMWAYRSIGDEEQADTLYAIRENVINDMFYDTYLIVSQPSTAPPEN